MAHTADALRKRWLDSLAHEKRASPHTLRAYGDDVARFLGFTVNHIGGASLAHGGCSHQKRSARPAASTGC